MKDIRPIALIAKKGLSRSLSTSKAKRKELSDWWQNRPKPIKLFPGEKELFRQGSVLVTDTRISHHDQFDRTLKTYMFEHMIHVHKSYYSPNIRIRWLCILLILIGTLTLLFTIVIDLMDDASHQFTPVYIPLLISLIVGLVVWRDMKPKYHIEWKMRDGIEGGIKTEPMLREWLTNNNAREKFMDNLLEAINKALASKAWWPHNTSYTEPAKIAVQHENSINSDNESQPSSTNDEAGKKNTLKLVTDSYQ